MLWTDGARYRAGIYRDVKRVTHRCSANLATPLELLDYDVVHYRFLAH